MPDLVIANNKDDRELDVHWLLAAGISVWVTVTETVRQLWCRLLPELTAQAAIPIWRDSWMVVGRSTFTGDRTASRLGDRLLRPLRSLSPGRTL